jgi:hypothetical protein
MRYFAILLSVQVLSFGPVSAADYRSVVDEYKTKYAAIRD